MSDSMQRYTLELDAHSIDDEFEQIILRDHDVKITDRSGEPWSVVFEGTRDQLSAMVANHWGGMEISDDDFVPVAPANQQPA
jgi:hypothetical protein